MDPQTEAIEPPPLAPLLAAVLALGPVKAMGRTIGLVAPLIILIAGIGAAAICAVVLRLTLLH